MVCKGTIVAKSAFSDSQLWVKGLCDYVIDVTQGCRFGCTFCYVPSTPRIVYATSEIQARGVDNPQQDWGEYSFEKANLVEVLKKQLAKKRTFLNTPAGKGVFLFSSGSDPYQDRETAKITRQCVEVLLEHNKRVRILTRSPLWIKDLDVLCHPNVTVGASIPHGNDLLSRQIEKHAPSPSSRLRALRKGKNAGCRIYVAMAPTPPLDVLEDGWLQSHLKTLAELDPELIFWEPINPRGSNLGRMEAAGLDWAKDLRGDAWAREFTTQWELVDNFAENLGIRHKIHFWPDKNLIRYVPMTEEILSWIGKPTIETWS